MNSMLWLQSQLDFQGLRVPENPTKLNTHRGKIGVSKIMKEKPNGSSPKNADGQAPFGLLGAYRITTKAATAAPTTNDRAAEFVKHNRLGVDARVVAGADASGRAPVDL